MKNKIIQSLLLLLFALSTSCGNTATQDKPASTDTAISEQKEVVVRDTVMESNTDTEVSSGAECIVKSTLELPYSQKLDPKKAAYQVANCKLLGVDKFLCGEKSLRYISLPKFENVSVILVPMDCGDFSYRYHLVTLFDKQVVSDYYVEGEWYEPGDEGYKELTSFSIDENYVITVSSNAVENGKATLKETVKLQILDDGILKKI